MVFCGKCGFQLTSGNMTCPRCGTPTEAGLNLEESQPDSPTIASSSILSINQSSIGTQQTISPGRSVEQQPLILGSNPYNYGTTENTANEATSEMGTQMAGTGQAPTRDAYPGYVPKSAANYPQQNTSYPGYSIQGATTNQQFGPSSSEDAEKARARGRIVGLLLILIGLLLILGALVFFIFTHNSSPSTSSSIHLATAAFALLCPPELP